MLLWYVNRGTGVVLVGLLTLSVGLGVIATVRAGSRRWPRFVTQSLHRNVALLTALVLAVHVATAVADEFVDLRWHDVLVPVSGAYAVKHQLELALGSAALYLLALVTATSLLRARIRPRWWRPVHLLAYLIWALGVVHGLLIGTDTGTAWTTAVVVAGVALVACAGVVRVNTWRHERRLAADALILRGGP